jgi:pyrroline-5-carboxylate reductase
MEKKLSIGFIGCGQMAASLVGGLSDAGYPTDKMGVFDIHSEKSAHLANEYGMVCYKEAKTLIEHMDVIVLCVKPQSMKALISEIKPSLLDKKPLLISVAAGIRTAHIENWLGVLLPIVRAMPNTPALLRSGATGLYANAAATLTQKNEAESLLRSVGVTVWLEDETLMDPLTALSGSGPAYFFYLMEALIKAGTRQGLTPESATILVLQTAMGAAKMVLESADTPAQLREKVTSKGGTTEAALAVLTDQGFADVIEKALKASTKRSVELGELLGQ